MESECRSCYVVISDLPSKPGFSDTAIVDKLVEMEFRFRPMIARTLRLGRVVNSRDQPIAVTYADTKDAEYLIDHTRLLRNSYNASDRQAVRINRDMTRAEAHTVFDHRKLRRQSRQRHASTLVTVQGQHNHSP